MTHDTLQVSDHNQLIKEIKGIRRIVINNRHGGFSLSQEAVLAYLDMLGIPVWMEYSDKFSSLMGPTYWLVPPGPDRVDTEPKNWHKMSLSQKQSHNAKYSQQVFDVQSIARDDPYLVKVVHKLRETADGKYASLKIVEVPSDVDWIIDEYDGKEWVAEKHRIWN
jgi:ABC-type transporter Mla MlaB component